MQQSAEAELILLCECTKVHVYVGGIGECRIEVVIFVFGSYWILIILIFTRIYKYKYSWHMDSVFANQMSSSTVIKLLTCKIKISTAGFL